MFILLIHVENCLYLFLYINVLFSKELVFFCACFNDGLKVVGITILLFYVNSIYLDMVLIKIIFS